MTFVPIVIAAAFRGDYRIDLTFNDGLNRTIDLEPLFEGPVFEPLREFGYFQRFFIDGRVVAWPNGADHCP